MGPHAIVVISPGADHDLSLLEAVEDPQLQALVPKFRSYTFSAVLNCTKDSWFELGDRMPNSAHLSNADMALGVFISNTGGEFSLHLDLAKIDKFKAIYGAAAFVERATRYVEDACRRFGLADDEDLWVATIKNHLNDTRTS